MSPLHRRLTPKRAIQAECRDCMGGVANYKAAGCPSRLCLLNDITLTYLQRIGEHCKQCAPDGKPAACENDGCPLYRYREGKNPRVQNAANGRDNSHLEKYSY